MSTTDGSSGARYVARFEDQFFGCKCDVEVIVNLATDIATSTLSMTSFLSNRPVLSISIDDLRLLASGIVDIKKHAGLLASVLPGASAHQLNCSVGGATVTVFQRENKPAAFSLTLGSVFRGGPLDELSTAEIDEAIRKLEALQRRVASKVLGKSVE